LTENDEKDYIKILRKDKHFQVSDDKMNVKTIDWEKKIQARVESCATCFKKGATGI
jgi:predicted enzyme involved in methoxymalonyl-ACP biosynthesis